MINTDKKFYGESIAYEILEDGYMIYLDGKPWISQRGVYGKPIDKSKSYEENCLLQIEEITRQPEPSTDDVETILTELESEVGING